MRLALTRLRRPVESDSAESFTRHTSNTRGACVCHCRPEMPIAAVQDNWTEGDSLYFLDPDGHRLEIHATTLADRLRHARADPWEGLVIEDDALEAVGFRNELVVAADLARHALGLAKRLVGAEASSRTAGTWLRVGRVGIEVDLAAPSRGFGGRRWRHTIPEDRWLDVNGERSGERPRPRGIRRERRWPANYPFTPGPSRELRSRSSWTPEVRIPAPACPRPLSSRSVNNR